MKLVTNKLQKSSYPESCLVDPFGREMNYLRLAITNRCNLRCLYCMPAEGIPLNSRDSILQFEEMEKLIQIFQDLGVNKLRITGGEPFRQNVVPLVKTLLEHDHLVQIETNGLLGPGADFPWDRRFRNGPG